MIINYPPIARLLWQTGNVQQELVLRQDDVVTIGRGDSNTIVIDSPRVSRSHARIEWAGEGFSILDLLSSNGTYVNSQRLEHLPFPLKNGDYIFLERFPIRYETLQQSQSQPKGSTLTLEPLGELVQEKSKPRLVIIEGIEAGREIIIDKDDLTIGRDSNAATWEIRLNDTAVSRPHARIENKEGICTLCDLGSANGTMVNDEVVIAPVILQDGDIIRIGRCGLVFYSKKRLI